MKIIDVNIYAADLFGDFGCVDTMGMTQWGRFMKMCHFDVSRFHEIS